MEYPRLVYKSRTDYKKVHSIADEELWAEEGYGAFEIVVLGRKPEGIVEPAFQNLSDTPEFKLMADKFASTQSENIQNMTISVPEKPKRRAAKRRKVK